MTKRNLFEPQVFDTQAEAQEWNAMLAKIGVPGSAACKEAAAGGYLPPGGVTWPAASPPWAGGTMPVITTQPWTNTTSTVNIPWDRMTYTVSNATGMPVNWVEDKLHSNGKP